MRALLIFCGALAIGAAIFQLMAKESGYLLVVWGNTSIETSLWFALISLLVIGFSLWLLLTLLRSGFRGAAATKRKLFNYSDEKAQRKTVDGLIDFIEGNWSAAYKKLSRSADNVKAPVINYLAAARSAYEMGEEQQALALLHKAEKSDAKGKLVAAITQARMQFANKEYEQALATLERATAIQPEHPVVLELRQQTYIALKDWTSLKALLPQLEKHKIGSMEERRELELELYQQQLEDVINNKNSLNSKDQLEKLLKFWEIVPRHIQEKQPMTTRYASQLMALAEHTAAEKILARSIPKHWHGQWLDLYGLLLCEDTKKPLQTAEQWLTKQPKNSHLLLALSRLCMQNHQWGRSVDYLEKSLALQPRAEAYAELARVLAYIGETEKSQYYYQKGLLVSVTTLAVNSVLS